MSNFESVVEQAVIKWFGALGYSYALGADIAPDGDCPERPHYGAVILEDRFRSSLARINPDLPAEALDDVARKVLRPPSPSVEENNLAFHRMLSRGAEVQIRKGGAVRGALVWLADFEEPDNNDWLVVNQFTVIEGQNKRRPDLVVFLNGLPVAVIELKNPEDPNATLEAAWNQLQTYKSQIGSLFHTNEILVVSDGTEARVGSLTAGFERFGPWRAVGSNVRGKGNNLQLKVLLDGLFEKGPLLDYLRHFIFWEAHDGLAKKIAGYHQVHAVNEAVAATMRAAAKTKDHRIGVVWHTQGSGKSVSMVYYAGKVILQPELANPTLVVLTDRNDLDGQLFGQFAVAGDLLPRPEQAESREHLRDLLKVASGGVVFTTIQKFGTAKNEKMPLLSDRRNILVIADEAHRSHYEFVEGFARNLRDALPKACYIGFTGTPIEADDRSTPAVFGDYIDTYTIAQAVEDGATVPLFYEARHAKLDLPEQEKPKIDEEFDEKVGEAQEAIKEKLKSSWSKLEALVGTEKRVGLVAKDIVGHWERRLEILDGKAMIVCMSRRICVDLYEAIRKLRPEWHSNKDEGGAIKVVMTGAASDPKAFQDHIRGAARQKAIEKRFKDPADPLRLVIVRDMWLTGFDVPCAHTLYLDKPMKGHTLMQAIARVNRVFRDKPSGLIVDCLGLADQLRQAVGKYGGKGGGPSVNVEEGLAVLEEKLGIVKAIFHRFDPSGYFSSDADRRLETLAGAADHVLGLDDGKKRFLDAMAALNKAAAIALHLEDARGYRDEIGFFQAVEGNLRKTTGGGGGETREDLNAAIRQIVSGAISAGGIVDLFGAAGFEKPDLSILSDAFLESVKKNPLKNLQIELLKRLLNDEIHAQSRRNVVQAKKLSEMLQRTLNAYRNRSLTQAEVVLALIKLAQEARKAQSRAKLLKITDDELAFYDALAAHGDVRSVMGDKVLAAIARDLVQSIRESVSIDWTQKEAVRAKMRSRIKRLLRKHGYPPDKEEGALATVIEQAEQVCKEWGEAA